MSLLFGIKEKKPWRTMSEARGATIGRAWAWRYHSISSDLQRPKSRILSVSTSAHSSAIAPLDHREQTDMSSGVMPSVLPSAEHD
jgi:hypothetical protein